MDLLALKKGTADKIEIGFLEPAQYATGIRKLAQQFLITLFRIPGTQVFDRQHGGGIGVFVGGNITSEVLEDMKADVAICVRQAEESLFKTQIGLDLPAIEKLKSANMIDFEINESAPGFNVKIELISQTGERTNVEIGL